MQSFAVDAVHLLLFSCFLYLFSTSAAQVSKDINCNSARNYTSGSVYEQNLNHTLTSLVANSSKSGFYITSVGQNHDAVYGLIQCIPEISNKDCKTCAKTAATEIRRRCFNQKEASILTNNCTLQYSDWRFFSTVNGDVRVSFHNLEDATDTVLFNRQMGNLVKNISSDAAASPSKFAVGITSYTDFLNIYAMVQCSRDLAENSCLTCLQGLISYIPTCCDKKVGGRMLSMSCNLRYEIYPFFLSPSPSLPEQNETTNGTAKTTNHAGKKNSEIVVLCTRSKRVEGVHEDGDKSMELLLMSLSSLRDATRNFSDACKLGQGGFGPVYKGKLFDGREIAVKRLSRGSGQGLEELKTEVGLVAKLLHRNLIRLLGFCLEDEEKLLVYEYLPNGSLDKILFDHNRRFCLEWERRQGNTNRIVGTHGYMSPEYVRNGHFSVKSDVYSFGVLVLEIVAGRKSSSFRNPMNLQSYAWQHWANGAALKLTDPILEDQWPRNEVLKCIHIGLLCVQESAADRPTMSEIVVMLSSYTVTSPAPSPPAFFVTMENHESGWMTENSGASSQYAESKPDSFQQSINGLTITDLDPR
ncbi:hypothetical protein SLA2020_409610 [Shorea laevis]